MRGFNGVVAVWGVAVGNTIVLSWFLGIRFLCWRPGAALLGNLFEYRVREGRGEEALSGLNTGMWK